MVLPKIRKTCKCGKEGKLVERILIMCSASNNQKASYTVECSCGTHTESYATKSAAIRAWNAGVVRSEVMMVK